jgi:hypothetical protein
MISIDLTKVLFMNFFEARISIQKEMIANVQSIMNAANV